MNTIGLGIIEALLLAAIFGYAALRVVRNRRERGTRARGEEA